MELLPGDLCRNFTQSAFIVAGIAYGERCMADDLPAPQQAGRSRGRGHPFLHGLARNLQAARAVEDIEYRKGREDILTLVVSQQVGAERKCFTVEQVLDGEWL